MSEEMKVGNLVAIKEGSYKRPLTSNGPKEYRETSIVGVIDDIIVSEKDGKYYSINGHSIPEVEILGFKVLVE